MEFKDWRRTVLLGLLGVGLAAPMARAATPEPGVSETDSTVVSELVVVVALGKGPAWWKASKGDSTVWILGLPPTRTPAGMRWDRRPLERRIRNARFMLAPLTEGGGFGPDDLPPVLPAPLAQKVASAAERLGEPIPPGKAITISSAMRLRSLYAESNNLTSETHAEINRTAKRANVRIVNPPMVKNYWQPKDLSPSKPEVAACLLAIIKDAETPAQLSRESAAYWAVGDVQKSLAVAPPGLGDVCLPFWRYRERTIAFQAKVIAEALEKPGHVVAIVHTGHLIGKNGVLERLRAQDYSIADPVKPPED